MSGDGARQVLVAPDVPAVVDAARRAWPQSLVVGRGRDGARGRRMRRTLARLVEEVDPDVVVAASEASRDGFAWLRDRRGLGAPVFQVADGGSLEAVAAGATTGRGWPVRRQDALFVYTDTGAVAQQVGAVAYLGPVAGGDALTAERVRAQLAEHVPHTMSLRRRLDSGGFWRRPRWVVTDEVRLDEHVREVVVSGAAEAHRVLEDFWSLRVRRDVPPWEMVVVRGLPDGSSYVAIKLHHALADGLSALGMFGSLLSFTSGPGNRQASGRPSHDDTTARLVARGLARLARGGFAPRTELHGRLVDLRRNLSLTWVPTDRLRATAKVWNVRTSELVIAAVVEAFHRIGVGRRIRLMVPVSMRSTDEPRTYGNWTATLTADVSMSALSLPERLVAVRTLLRESGSGGEPVAATFALRALGLLPPPLHRAASRFVYSSRFFNAVVSYVPGPREPRLFAGAPVHRVHPVLGLAAGVRVAVGIMPWAENTGISVLADHAVAADGEALATGVRDVLGEYADLEPS